MGEKNGRKDSVRTEGEGETSERCPEGGIGLRERRNYILYLKQRTHGSHGR